MAIRSCRHVVRMAWTAATLTLGVARPLRAQSPGPLELPRLRGEIRIDGIPDEAAWQQIPALPLTMYAPVFRGAPAERTEVRVAYDDEHLYAAGWFYDTEPSLIRINSLYRDRWNGDDAFAIYVDAFGDKRNAKWFGTTPGGERRAPPRRPRALGVTPGGAADGGVPSAPPTPPRAGARRRRAESPPRPASCHRA